MRERVPTQRQLSTTVPWRSEPGALAEQRLYNCGAKIGRAWLDGDPGAASQSSHCPSHSELNQRIDRADGQAVDDPAL